MKKNMKFLVMVLLSGAYTLNLVAGDHEEVTDNPVVVVADKTEDIKAMSVKDMQLLIQLKYLQAQQDLLKELASKKDDKKKDDKNRSVSEQVYKLGEDTVLKGIDLSRQVLVYSGGGLIAVFTLSGTLILLAKMSVLEKVFKMANKGLHDITLDLFDGVFNWALGDNYFSNLFGGDTKNSNRISAQDLDLDQLLAQLKEIEHRNFLAEEAEKELAKSSSSSWF